MKNALVISWIRRLEENNNKAMQDFGTLQAEVLNWKPAQDVWSVGQCLDHLIVTNSTYIPLIQQILDGKQTKNFYQKIPLLPYFFGKKILQSVGKELTSKVKTFPVFEPTSSQVDDDVVNRLIANHKEITDLLSQMHHINFMEEIISSPAKSFITYNLSTALEIIISHELRHFEQANRVLMTMKNTKG